MLPANEDPAIYKHVFDCSEDLIFIIDNENKRFVNVNKPALEELNYLKEELLQISPDEISPVFLNREFPNLYADNITEKSKPNTFFTNLTGKSKSAIEVQVRIKNFTEKGRSYTLISATSDSVIKQADQELKLKATLLNSISDALISFDRNSVITEWNSYAEEMFGWTAKEAVGKTGSELAEVMFLDTTQQEVRKKIDVEGFWKGELLAKRKGGEYFEVFVSTGIIRNEAGDVTGNLAVVRDISKYKTLEKKLLSLNEELEQRVTEKTEELSHVLEQYRTIVESVKEGIWQLDENNRTTFVNKYFSNLLGYSEEEMLGRPVFDFMTEEARLEALELIKNRRQGISEEHEFTLQRKDLSLVDTVLQTTSLQKDGKYAGALGVVTDITERKKAEEKLIANEKRFRALFEFSNDGIALLTEKGVILDVSASVEKILGIKKEDLIGSSRLDYLVPEDIHIVVETFTEVVTNASTVKTSQYRAIVGDKVIKWLEGTYANLLNEPAVNAIVLNFRDITEQKHYEKKLQESTERLREAQRLAKIGNWEIELPGFVANWYGETHTIFETDPHNFTPSRSNFLKLVHPDDREDLKEVFKNSIKKSSANFFEHRIISPTGKEKIVTARWQVFKDEQGMPCRVAGTSQDVTLERRAEEENRFKANLLNVIGQAVIVSDINNIITFWNKAAEEIYGWTELEALGNKLEKIVPAYHSNKQVATRLKEIKKGNSWSEEFEVKRKDGTLFTVYQTDSPIYDRYGKFSGIIGISTDITVRKKIENELRRSEELYKNAQELGKLGHWELNLSNYLLTWSEEIYKLFNLPPFSFQPDHNTFLEFLHPDDREAVEKKLDLGFRGLEDYNIVHRVVLRNGEIKYMHEVGALIRDNSGNITKFTGMVQDVTEQKLFEENLRQSEKNYRLLFEENPVPLWMFKEETLQIIEVNQTAIQHYGYTREEFLKMTIFDVRAPEDREFLQSLSNEKAGNFDGIVRHRKKNGDIIFSKVTANRVNYKGEIVFIVAIQDMTRETLLQQELTKSEQQLSLIFNSSVNGMYLLKVEENDEFRLEAVNDALCEAVRFERENLVGKLILEVVDKESLIDVLPKFYEVAKNGEIKKFTVESTRSVDRILEHTLIPIKDTKEKVNQILAIRTDITEQKLAELRLKKSEEQYRILFSKSPLPMWIYDTKDYNFLEVNAAATEHYGYTREEFLSMKLYDILTEELVENFKALNLRSNPETFVSDALHVKKNGDIIKIHVTSNLIEFDNKVARLALIIDRTEQEKSKEELINTTNELRSLASHLQNIREEERTHMAREIHDELGQQLTGIKMDVAWVSKKLHSTDEIINLRLKALLSLIDGTISTVRKIAAELRPSILDDLGLAEAIDWQSEEFAKRAGIEVDFTSNVHDIKFSPNVSISIFRIFQEALTNVVRHANATRVDCSLNKQGNNLVLNISDNGKGFSTYANPHRKTLGLLGMKERVIMLNGKYNIESMPGKGTTVSIQIPLN